MYILRSLKSGRFYTGSAASVAVRLKQHNAGKNKSTKGGVPWVVMRVEEFQTRREAMDQEKKVKARGIERYFTEHSLLPGP
jgi:putative endonuclease